MTDCTSGESLTHRRGDLRNADTASCSIIPKSLASAHDALESPLWYFQMMQSGTPTTQRPDPARQTSTVPRHLPPGLATLHAKALFRPVPPVYFDDDGFICGDNSPMAESETQFPILSYWHGALYAHYRSRGRLVCVLADHLLLVDREVGRAAVVPDVMVAFDVEPGERRSYKVWDEPKAPDLALEVLSEDTWRVDVFEKPALYADLGVREYWIFDPRDISRGRLRLEGWRLGASGDRVRLPSLSDGEGHSEVLGLDLVPDGRCLWLRDPETGVILPDHLGALEGRDRAETERRRAEDERQRAEEGRRRAEEERQRMQEENARLRAEIGRLRSRKT